VDASWETAPAWFQEGVRKGLAGNLMAASVDPGSEAGSLAHVVSPATKGTVEGPGGTIVTSGGGAASFGAFLPPPPPKAETNLPFFNVEGPKVQRTKYLESGEVNPMNPFA
jgi:hypothetical protein